MKHYKQFIKITPEDAGSKTLYNFEERKIIYDIIPKQSKVLFVGCGDGVEIKNAKDYGLNAVGVNFKTGNKKIAKEKFNIDIIQADFHDLPFRNKEFDCICSFHSLEHSPAPIFALLEWNRVLKENGKIIIETPKPVLGHQGMGFGLRHIICPTELQGKSLLMKTGFKNITFKEIRTGLLFCGDKMSDGELPKEYLELIYA